MTNDNVILNEEIELNKEEISNVLMGILDKGANYSIKSMSVSDHIKEMLLDVKNTFINNDFKKIMKNAINGAIKDGEEINNKEYNKTDINTVTDKAFEGGLPHFINLGLEMVTSVKKAGNIFSNFIDDFVNRIKSYVLSAEFKNKVKNGVSRSLNKVEKFKGLCAAWYNAYDLLNTEEIKEIANQLKEMKNKVKFDNECLNENEIIQNVTDIIAKRGEKISKAKVDIYENLREI